MDTSEWLPMIDAPKNGREIILKFENPSPPYKKGYSIGTYKWETLGGHGWLFVSKKEPPTRSFLHSSRTPIGWKDIKW